MKKNLLLLSSSTIYGQGYLDYVIDEVRDFFSGISRLLFVPFALADHSAYAARARDRFARLGIDVESLHEKRDKARAVLEAEAIFIGGGNTFRLLQSLYEFELLDPIRTRVESGLPYMGASAGSVVACPTIRTTNDMPIVQPPSFDALGLIPWQINAHYLDADPASRHMGETREERLLQYLEENETPVIGLREGAFLRWSNGRLLLKGVGGAGARIFRRGCEPVEVTPGNFIEL